ncbi:hypothetical protein HNQ36_002676 [Afipia massiliensis]|jgi:hypothetical protein|uniref:Uncharacterized protein n=1 Tax=Afipia massiliensis TaxID=211460 RepID=A0A840N176_9BRAD|nr:hypothetical protein [Afipia massiliensis]MBB5052702.1 hypothetical protein [Afipia massiliensis]
MEKRYQHYRLEWRGLEIEVRYCPHWSACFAHLEIESMCRSPLPVTDTGYRSVYTQAATVERLGGPLSLVEDWLDRQADHKEQLHLRHW